MRIPLDSIQDYDILQILKDGSWLDFATIRDRQDARRALELVETGYWEGGRQTMRIVRPFPFQVIAEAQEVL